jgi:hypothetical protein
MSNISVNDDLINDTLLNYETMTELGLTKTMTFEIMNDEDLINFLQQKPNNEQMKKKNYILKEIMKDDTINVDELKYLLKNLELDKDIKIYNNEDIYKLYGNII